MGDGKGGCWEGYGTYADAFGGEAQEGTLLGVCEGETFEATEDDGVFAPQAPSAKAFKKKYQPPFACRKPEKKGYTR